MKLCYNLQTCSETSSLEQDVRLCAEAGFSLIEIDFKKAKDYLSSHTFQDLEMLLKQYGLKSATINAIFNINFRSEEGWKDIFEQFSLASKLASVSGADTVIVLSSERTDLPQGKTEQELFDDTALALHRLADMGREMKLKVAFEPVGTMAIGDIQTAWKLIRQVNRPEVGLAVDSFNLYLWDVGSDFDELSKVDGKKIFIAHINDAEKIPFARIDQMHRCMPGDGRIDVQKYMKCLRDTGYDGPVSVEVLNPNIWAKGPQIVIPEAYQKIAKFVLK